jgi:hypothetical protein
VDLFELENPMTDGEDDTNGETNWCSFNYTLLCQFCLLKKTRFLCDREHDLGGKFCDRNYGGVGWGVLKRVLVTCNIFHGCPRSVNCKVAQETDGSWHVISKKFDEPKWQDLPSKRDLTARETGHSARLLSLLILVVCSWHHSLLSKPCFCRNTGSMGLQRNQDVAKRFLDQNSWIIPCECFSPDFGWFM